MRGAQFDGDIATASAEKLLEEFERLEAEERAFITDNQHHLLADMENPYDGLLELIGKASQARFKCTVRFLRENGVVRASWTHAGVTHNYLGRGWCAGKVRLDRPTQPVTCVECLARHP